MRLPRLLVCTALVLLVVGPANLSLAEPATPEASPSRANKGFLVAELAGALLGDILATAVTAAAFTPLYLEYYCEDPEGDGCTSHVRPILGGAMSLGFVSRVSLVGGLTAACARPSRGEGTAWAAMLGATPGAALIFGSWFLPKKDGGGIGVALGHVGSVVGAVVAYRASARRRHQRESLQHAQLLPQPYVSQHGAAGLMWSGRF